MITCKITIKIKDYFPKIDTIPYENYICLFNCGDYEDQIPFLPDESKVIQHQIKNITSDMKYKVHILDYNDMSLIGMCEMTILYEIINQITPPNGFIQEQQKKLLIDLNTKRKLFGTVINTGDIFLNIYAEVFVVSKSNIEKKYNKTKKNFYQNTPQCFIKYNFNLNKDLDYSPKSIKNISLLNNSNSEKINLYNSKKDKNHTNKNSNNNYINYKSIRGSFREKEKEIDDNKSKWNYNTFNNIKKGIKNFSNNKNQNKYSNNNMLKEQNKKIILDLLEDKKIKNKKLDKDKKGKDNKNDIDNESNNKFNNKKEGFLTEQNFNMNESLKFDNKYIIYNHKLTKKNNEEKSYNNKFKSNDNYSIKRYKNNTYSIKNRNNLDDKGNNNTDDEMQNNLLDNVKEINMLSPKDTFNKNEDNFNKLNKTVKNNKILGCLESQFIYKSKNKIINTEKNFKKNYIYLNKNIYDPEETENNEDTNKNNSFLSSNSNEEVFLDIDKVILEKGAELRNDFIIQLKPYIKFKNPHNKNINNFKEKYNNLINNEELNQINNEFQQNMDNININHKKDNNGVLGNTNFYLDIPQTEKKSQLLSYQNKNNSINQENVKNNIVKLIEFYSLLNYKLKKLSLKNVENKKKSIIFKELFSNQIKKNNKLINKSNLTQFINYISTTINQQINEKILYLFPKIKKHESTIYQFLFDTYYTEDEVIKFREYENYDEQTNLFLLLTIAKSLINKYGNISQIFDEEINKKNFLKECLTSYDLVEKNEGDKDFVNLEEISNEIKIKNEKELKGLNGENENKFKVIKEVDEDKEEENEEEEEEIKIEKNKEIIEDFIDNDENNKKGNNHDKKNRTNLNNKEEENIDVKINDEGNINDEDLIEKIIIEEFKKKNKDNKFYFKKIGLNEYLYNNIKIKVYIDKDDDLRIFIEEKNEDYNFDDFMKLFNEDENEENKLEKLKIEKYKENKDSKKNIEKNDINDKNLNKENIDINDEK